MVESSQLATASQDNPTQSTNIGLSRIILSIIIATFVSIGIYISTDPISGCPLRWTSLPLALIFSPLYIIIAVPLLAMSTPWMLIYPLIPLYISKRITNRQTAKKFILIGLPIYVIYQLLNTFFAAVKAGFVGNLLNFIPYIFIAVAPVALTYLEERFENENSLIKTFYLSLLLVASLHILLSIPYIVADTWGRTSCTGA